MSIEKFKPIVWAKQFEKDLDMSLVGYENTNHQYEGLATQPGDSIKILGLGEVTTRHWTDGKLHTLDDPEAIESTSMTIPINQVCDFNFFVDDLDKRQAQNGGSLLSEYMSSAKDKVAQAQDAFIFKMAADKNIKVAVTATSLVQSDILANIDTAYLKLLKNNVSRSTQVTMIAPPEFNMVLKRAYVDLDTNNSDMMKNGKVGRYSGITVKESNNLYVDSSGYTYIPVMTNKAISFVKPYIHLEPYRAEKSFSDAVKGYALYDGAVTRPKEITVIKVKL